ncbi:MAG: sulfatase-like hydrolase/transferase [Aeromicrobium sp.]
MSERVQPNIVFILCDNVGWGDLSCYGGNTPTPRIDKLAAEGIRFQDYTVECQCSPSRSAILTGRQSVRSGTYTVPLPGTGPSGLAPWEYTVADLLSDAGYATSLFGKWHLGEVEGRLPTDQGFDEWWGYKNSADETGYTSYATYNAIAKLKGIETPKLWEGKKGEKSTVVREFDLEVRPLLDELIVDKATDFIKRSAKGDKPFFTYVGLSHVHPPERAHPDFDQTDPSRLGLYADLMAEMDHRVGQIVDCVAEAGVADNTVIAFSSDNATSYVPSAGFGGSNGPWRGDFSTPPAEGSMRVPAMVTCPGRLREGVVTEEMLSCHDWYQTFAALAGASDKVPTDRPLDGVEASKFLLGDSAGTGRESIVFFGPDASLMSVKAHNIKVWLRYAEGFDKPIVKPQLPIIFDLGSDPGERHNLFNDKMDMGWELAVALPAVFEYEKSFAQYPNIKPGQDFDGYPEPGPATA